MTWLTNAFRMLLQAPEPFWIQIGRSLPSASDITDGFCYAGLMKTATVVAIALISCLMATSLTTVAQATLSADVSFATVSSASTAERLAAAVSSIAPIPREQKLRRNIAQATFCLPQNIIGRLLYGLLQLTGSVVETAAMNEVKIVVTKARVGVSLGRYILLHESLLTENIVQHEYGHVLQGYKHGPFFLLLEGVTSFVQVSLSMIFPSFADGYYDRWPENEASELGRRASMEGYNP
ncbi:hypothetical protein ACFLSG_02835 [Candidatus Bipolaricaulota bacterium]